MMKPRRWLAMTVVFLLAGGAGWTAASAQDVLEKKAGVPKLIGQADLDCSFFVMNDKPKLRIAGPVVSGEFSLFSDSMLFYANLLSGAPAAAVDSEWTILEWGPRVRGTNPSEALGNIVYRRGRAKVVRIEAGRPVMKIEKVCGVIEAGCYLVPYEKADIIVGPELPYEVAFRETAVPTGRIVFMESETLQVGARNFWVLIDVGAEQGLKVADQLVVYRPEGRKNPPRPISNAIVIQTGGRWAVVKILDSRDTVFKDDLVQLRPVE